MSISRTLGGSPFSIATIWAARKNSSRARRFGKPVSKSVSGRVSDLSSESRVQLACLLVETGLQPGGASGGLGRLVDQILDEQFRIGSGLAAASDIADGPDLRAVVGYGRCQELLCRGHD